ncbi:hypothetical protein TNCV_1204001 [Trichonephila clavipes]|nr:hypothetical protein TNCV_1204001 [Trichonephila clavipes]
MKTSAGFDCLTVSTEKCFATDDDNACTASIMDDKDILEFVQSSNNSISADSEDGNEFCQVIYSHFGLAIHQNDHQARRTFVEWAQNEIAVVPDFHKRILFSDEAHFWLKDYVNKQTAAFDD